MTGDLVREGRATMRDLSSLTIVGGGGAPRAPEQVKQIDATLAAAPATGWGMTETNAIGTGIGGPAYLERPASSGRASMVLDIKVVDDDGRTLAAGQRGELLIRGGSMFNGYWNRPEVNATVFEDGWFRTGDVAYLDDEGYLFIVDRIKDLIIRGGENIGCGHVEAAMLMHPDVREAAVYSVPDERLGEEVGATIHAAPEIDLDALRVISRSASRAIRGPTVHHRRDRTPAAHGVGQGFEARTARGSCGADGARGDLATSLPFTGRVETELQRSPGWGCGGRSRTLRLNPTTPPPSGLQARVGPPHRGERGIG